MIKKITLLADNIRSLENVGSLFRLADAIMVERVILVGISAYPDMGESDTRRPWLRERMHKLIKKTALSGIDVPFEYYQTAEEAVDSLKKRGTSIICIEQDERSVLYNSEYSVHFPCCIVLGNELDGVSKVFLDSADLILEIPMFGKGKSLNVSVSAGIVAYQILNSKVL
jgi:tRNA G18 (ribose-2'-O)-methylase SpoU